MKEEMRMKKIISFVLAICLICTMIPIFASGSSLTFSIDGKEYGYEEGMSLKRWVDTEYNTDNFTYDGAYFWNADKTRIIERDFFGTYNISPSEPINSSYTYITIPMVINFKIDNKSYTAEVVYYFNESAEKYCYINYWVESERNVDGFIYFERKGYITTADESAYLVDSNGEQMFGYEKVHEGDQFYTKSFNEEAEVIHFKVDDESYTANVGDTFEVWVNSENNKDGYKIDGDMLFNSDNTGYVGDEQSYDSTIGSYLSPSYKEDSIEDNGEYYTERVTTFSIDGKKYYASLTDTFETWVNKWFFNTDGYVVSENEITTNDSAKNVVDDEVSKVSKVDSITPNGTYYTNADSSTEPPAGNTGGDGDNGDSKNPTDPSNPENTEDADNIITIPNGNGKTNIILNTQATNFKVVVPIRIDISMDAEGQVSIPDSYVVSNESAWGPIVITGISAVKASGWEIKSFDTDFANMKVNTKAIAMKINDAEVNSDGSVVLSDSLKATINYNSSKSLSFEAKLPAQKSAWVENALAIVFTVDFDKV